jgi:SAM-dependent methyltransferase
MDGDALGFAAETFDAVTCACTLMFSPEPERTIREIRRVLKPRGRFGIVVWDEPSLNPFSMVLSGVMSRFITLPPFPTRGTPGPFRFAAVQALESVLRSGGFSTFTIEDRAMLFEFPSVDAYLQIVSEVAGWTRRLQALPPADVSRLRQAVVHAAQSYEEAGQIRIGAAVHCAAGQK